MIEKGDIAPDFTLPGYDGYEGTTRRYTLSEATESGSHVVLFFYPADFSPVCTPQMCAIRDAEFFSYSDDVLPWGISADTTYAHRAFAEQNRFDFPLLSDTGHGVADEYGVSYDEWEGHRKIPKRAIFLINPNRRVQYVWHSDDAYVKPDLWPVKEAIETAIAEGTLDVPHEILDTEPDFETIPSKE